jgi:dihydroxyacetone kinase
MSAAAGRSSYVPDAALAGHVDPGARAVAIWLDAVARAL